MPESHAPAPIFEERLVTAVAVVPARRSTDEHGGTGLATRERTDEGARALDARVVDGLLLLGCPTTANAFTRKVNDGRRAGQSAGTDIARCVEAAVLDIGHVGAVAIAPDRDHAVTARDQRVDQVLPNEAPRARNRDPYHGSSRQGFVQDIP